MSYKLRFHELALVEWNKLDNSIREPLKNKLAERLNNLRVPATVLLLGCATVTRSSYYVLDIG